MTPVRRNAESVFQRHGGADSHAGDLDSSVYTHGKPETAADSCYTSPTSQGATGGIRTFLKEDQRKN
jgi:hypothetical protein